MKIGDRFECEDFLGFIFITSISDTEVRLKYEHVSGEDYYTKMEINEFSFNRYTNRFHNWLSV